MHEVLLRVVDFAQLVGKAEHVGHPFLHQADRVPAASLAASLGNPRPFRGHEFVEQRLVPGEAFVQFVVVALVADVHRADQVDRDAGVFPFRADVTNDRRIELGGHVLGVANDAEIFLFLRAFLSRSLGRILLRGGLLCAVLGLSLPDQVHHAEAKREQPTGAKGRNDDTAQHEKTLPRRTDDDTRTFFQV